MSSKVIVTIFGASGDLAKRKLYPSLFRLYKSGNLSDHFAVIGTARRPWSKEYFESVVVESISDLADSPEQRKNLPAIFTTKATMSMIRSTTSSFVNFKISSTIPTKLNIINSSSYPWHLNSLVRLPNI